VYCPTRSPRLFLLLGFIPVIPCGLLALRHGGGLGSVADTHITLAGGDMDGAIYITNIKIRRTSGVRRLHRHLSRPNAHAFGAHHSHHSMLQ